MLGWLLNLGFAGGSVVVTPDEVILFVAEIRQAENFDAGLRQAEGFKAEIRQTESFDADTL